MKVNGIIVAGGSGTRLGGGMNKALRPLAGRELFLYAVEALRPFCDRLIMAVKSEEQASFGLALKKAGLQVDAFSLAGAERQNSVENALLEIDPDCDIVLIHDAARPFASPSLVRAVILTAMEKKAAVPCVAVQDTLKRLDDQGLSTLSREGLYQAQTPQGFRREILLKAYAQKGLSCTDDASLAEAIGVKAALVAGEKGNYKLTTAEDWTMAEQGILASQRMGLGFDAHRLVEGRKLVLCGVEIPYEKGLLGHSDADVALHALMDALLGACALGDIGQHFPDSQAQYKGISSMTLLEETCAILQKSGFKPSSCDLTITAQRPKLAPYRDQMRMKLAQTLGLPLDRVSVKATTSEGMGYEGRGEGISCQALAVVVGIK